MTIIALQTSGAIDVGRTVIIENEIAREFNPQTDSVNEIVGVVCAKNLTSYRTNNFIDGPPLIEKSDLFAIDEKLQYELVNNQFVPNPNYDGNYDPLNDQNTIYVVVKGLASILKSQLLPASWKKIKNGSQYDWYVI